jgi:hypothetical protein
MKTYKSIAGLLADWIILGSNSSRPPVYDNARMNTPITNNQILRHLLLITSHHFLITSSPVTNHQSLAPNHLSPTVQISSQLHSSPANPAKGRLAKVAPLQHPHLVRIWSLIFENSPSLMPFTF